MMQCFVLITDVIRERYTVAKTNMVIGLQK